MEFIDELLYKLYNTTFYSKWIKVCRVIRNTYKWFLFFCKNNCMTWENTVLLMIIDFHLSRVEYSSKHWASPGTTKQIAYARYLISEILDDGHTKFAKELEDLVNKHGNYSFKAPKVVRDQFHSVMQKRQEYIDDLYKRLWDHLHKYQRKWWD